MQMGGYSVYGSTTDQFSLMTYYNGASLTSSDTLEIYSVLGTTRGSAPRTLHRARA